MLIDTHCHIQDSDYPLNAEDVIKYAHDSGVEQIICVGTSVQNSRQAIYFANNHDGVFATVGVHPHYADKDISGLEKLIDTTNTKIVAIGEIGLDYHDSPSSRESQKQALKQQIELAIKYNLPVAFHVRDAYDDFWPIFDSYDGVRGVLHCFSDTMENAQKGIDRGLYIGVTGISTFTKDPAQQQMFATIPLNRILLETDAPYLTPVPFRGKINEPAFVRHIADFGGKSRQVSFDEIANITTTNAKKLFSL